ncbi:MAG: heme ABC exporter ATP-binding protein CcmA [Rhodospirillales bacterium]|nr:heme ABC exporter ATP-binding protein CcmA [Rhodospirillales bacterium]
MAAVGTSPVLEAESLTCERGGRRLFVALSFALEPGEIMVLRGPNGSGKSSLLRLMAGLMPAAEGTLRWHGAETTENPTAWRRAMVFTGHGNPVKPNLSVRENLTFWSGFENGTVAVDEALDALDLGWLADLPSVMLSAGQQRRLGLARLALRPGGCWLMDEPTVTLDTASVERLHILVARHRQNGGIAVLATHEGIEFEDVRTLTLGRAP